MELNKTGRWFYFVTAIWVILLLGIGSWWLYLVFKLHGTLAQLNIPQLGDHDKFFNMIKWEGIFFFFVLALLGMSLIIMYYRDMKKSKAVQIFFSTLSHELKTPLASMRLQAEVLKDLAQDETHSHEQLSLLTNRLIEDTHQLEGELEKSLQLSRIEQNASLSLSSMNLERYLKHFQSKISTKLELDFGPNSSEILADELAIKIIFRNLFENTQRHNKECKLIKISSRNVGSQIEVIYNDFGNDFKGDKKRLGQLFYKYNSSKGSGLGLYLIKSLVKNMRGDFKILSEKNLIFHFKFQSTGVQDESL
jgi:signal transduction histidine kinase